MRSGFIQGKGSIIYCLILGLLSLIEQVSKKKNFPISANRQLKSIFVFAEVANIL